LRHEKSCGTNGLCQSNGTVKGGSHVGNRLPGTIVPVSRMGREQGAIVRFWTCHWEQPLQCILRSRCIKDGVHTVGPSIPFDHRGSIPKRRGRTDSSGISATAGATIGFCTGAGETLSRVGRGESSQTGRKSDRRFAPPLWERRTPATLGERDDSADTRSSFPSARTQGRCRHNRLSSSRIPNSVSPSLTSLSGRLYPG